MSRPFRGWRAAAAGALVVLGLGLAACGDDAETTSSSTTGGESSSAATADGIISCLDDAGVGASVNDAGITGLEVEHTRIDIPIGELEQGGEIVVFKTAAEAKNNATAAAAGGGISQMTPAGNTVYGFDAAADPPVGDEEAVEGCVPQS